MKSSKNIRKYENNPPIHFGYNDSVDLARFYNNYTYLVITKLGEINFPSKYPNNKEVWEFYDNDFYLLSFDKNVNHIYSTDFEFDTFIIVKYI